MTIQISYITPEQTIDLRHLVLRQGRPRISSHMEGDDFKSTKHIGAFIDSKCVGVLSLFQTKTRELTEENQYQLRGMAVAPEFQGLQIGKKLVLFSENELKKMNVGLLWCNARETAVQFYKKLQFEVISDVFHIPDVGPHYRMSKKLI